MQNIGEAQITIKHVAAVLFVALVLIVVQSCEESQQRKIIKTEQKGVTNDYSNK